MCKYIYRALFCVILFCINILFAKVVTISGTVTDTILETGNGKDPVLKFVPVEACSVSISAGCTETVLDKYFVKTDKFGFYSLTVELPETCVYKYYLFRINGKTSTQTMTPSGLGIPEDSITTTLKKDLTISHEIPRDSVKTAQYMHYFTLQANNFIHGGDTVTVSHSIRGLSDNPDTLLFKKCIYRILLLTTSKDTVYNADFNSTNLSNIYLPKGWSTDYYHLKVPVPKDLQKINTSFAQDRKLTLELKLYDHDIAYTTPAFLVIDKDIPVSNTTGIHNLKNMRLINSTAVLATKSNKLHLLLTQPGIYSIDLFTIDGRMLQNIVKERYFSAGEHMYDMSSAAGRSSKLLVAKLKGNGITATALVNKL